MDPERTGTFSLDLPSRTVDNRRGMARSPAAEFGPEGRRGRHYEETSGRVPIRSRMAMLIAEKAALLGEMELFAALDKEAQLRLAERLTERSYKKGSFIFLQGDHGEALYVLVKGLLKVVVTSEQGEEMLLVTLAPPAVFGELSVIDGGLRSASVEVVEASTVLRLERSTFTELGQRCPALTFGLLRAVSGLLRRLTDQASDFVFLDLPGRVAKLLLRLAETQGAGSPELPVLDLHLTQSDLAKMVGGSRQSVNQALRSLARRGCIELRGRTIVLKRPDLLRARAGMRGGR